MGCSQEQRDSLGSSVLMRAGSGIRLLGEEVRFLELDERASLPDGDPELPRAPFE